MRDHVAVEAAHTEKQLRLQICARHPIETKAASDP